MARDGFVGFKAHPQLVEALKAASARQGVSVSEVVRCAAEDHLAREAALETQIATGRQIFDWLASAARGSLESQRTLARAACDKAFERDSEGRLLYNSEHCLREGLMLARLAAAQGDMADQGMVISMIALLADVCGEENVPYEIAEAVARIDLAADDGDEHAADFLPALAEGLSPEIMAAAGQYRKIIESQHREAA